MPTWGPGPPHLGGEGMVRRNAAAPLWAHGRRTAVDLDQNIELSDNELLLANGARLPRDRELPGRTWRSALVDVNRY